jgi:hypothetical protein
MNITEQHQGAVTVLKPDGPLVADDVKGFAAALTKAIGTNLGRCVVDLSAVPFVDHGRDGAWRPGAETLCGQQNRSAGVGADRAGVAIRSF